MCLGWLVKLQEGSRSNILLDNRECPSLVNTDWDGHQVGRTWDCSTAFKAKQQHLWHTGAYLGPNREYGWPRRKWLGPHQERSPKLTKEIQQISTRDRGCWRFIGADLYCGDGTYWFYLSHSNGLLKKNMVTNTIFSTRFWRERETLLK